MPGVLRNFISSATARFSGVFLSKPAAPVVSAPTGAPRLVRSASTFAPADRSGGLATAATPGVPRLVRSISLVSRGEFVDEYERRLVRGHSAFRLTQTEQQETGFPEYVGFTPRDPGGERETKKAAPVEVRYSHRSEMPLKEGTEWRRIYTGQSPLGESQVQPFGAELHLGELTEAGAARFKKSVEGYDHTRFDVTGTGADNCAQFVGKMADDGLGMELEKEPGRQETSASITSKMTQAVREELADPTKNPLARELRTLPRDPDRIDGAQR